MEEGKGDATAGTHDHEELRKLVKTLGGAVLTVLVHLSQLIGRQRFNRDDAQGHIQSAGDAVSAGLDRVYGGVVTTDDPAATSER
jgi:hypothetical protein